MLRIAIIDDEESVAKRLDALITAYCKDRGINLFSTYYENAVEFLESYKAEFDMVFMDIKMPELNGMNAAQELRELDKTVLIVFVTNMRQYAVKGYSVDALDFIIKPVEEFSLNTLMDKALRIISSRKQDKAITIKTKNKVNRVSVKDICYIEVRAHKLTYKTTLGTIESWGALADIEKQLPEEYFVRCNNCYMVNLQYITSVDGEDIIVYGDTLKMARTRKKEFLASLARFFGEGGT